MAFVEHGGGWSVPAQIECAVEDAFTFKGRTTLGCFARRAPIFAATSAGAGAAWLAGLLPGTVAATIAAGAALLLCAITVRRLHDVGRRGWPVWLQAVALAGMVGTGFALHGHSVGLLLGEGLLAGQLALFAAGAGLTWRRATREGDAGPNRYGPAPR